MLVVDRRQEHPKHVLQWKVEVSAIFPMVGSEVCCRLYALIRVIQHRERRLKLTELFGLPQIRPMVARIIIKRA